MKIRVKISFGNYNIGQILDPSAMQAGEWIARGWAEKFVPPAPMPRMFNAPETATARQPDTATVGRRGRHR
jgi:hypothetical protein